MNNHNGNNSSCSDDDSTDTDSSSSPSNKPCILKENDVLIGRGAPSVRHKGNIYFRKLVENRMDEYVAAGNDHDLKTNIAKSIIASIHKNHGRFLCKTDDGILQPITDENFVIEKSKQAFRDYAKKTKFRLSNRKTSSSKKRRSSNPNNDNNNNTNKKDKKNKSIEKLSKSQKQSQTQVSSNGDYDGNSRQHSSSRGSNIAPTKVAATAAIATGVTSRNGGSIIGRNNGCKFTVHHNNKAIKINNNKNNSMYSSHYDNIKSSTVGYRSSDHQQNVSTVNYDSNNNRYKQLVAEAESGDLFDLPDEQVSKQNITSSQLLLPQKLPAAGQKRSAVDAVDHSNKNHLSNDNNNTYNTDGGDNNDDINYPTYSSQLLLLQRQSNSSSSKKTSKKQQRQHNKKKSPSQQYQPVTIQYQAAVVPSKLTQETKLDQKLESNHRKNTLPKRAKK